MKILHTSDWHVGKTLRGRSRAPEHEDVLAEICEIARQEAVDLVIVAGDMFDTSAPSPDAERLVYRTLLDLGNMGCPVLLISGNHDNERRLQAVEPLFALCHVVIRAKPAASDRGGVFSFRTHSGEAVNVALLPFVSARYFIRANALMSLEGFEHEQRYDGRMRRLVETLCEGFSEDAVNIVAAHLMLTDGEQGGGERNSQSGPDYMVSPGVFPAAAHYAALGHLHRAQRIPGACPIWYCGAPLDLDFPSRKEERRYGDEPRCVLVVEARPGAPAEVRAVPLGSGRRLRTVRGSLAELAALAGTTGEDYLRIYVRESPRAGISAEVREMFPEVVDVQIDRPDAPASAERPSRAGRSPHDLFCDFLTERGEMDEREVALFDRLLDEVDAPDPA